MIRDSNIPDDWQIALDESMRADFTALMQDAPPYAKLQFPTSKVGVLRLREDRRKYRLLKESAGIADQVIQTVW